jgi:pimeloyl-ACP methyl ester carboxylesterase
VRSTVLYVATIAALIGAAPAATASPRRATPLPWQHARPPVRAAASSSCVAIPGGKCGKVTVPLNWRHPGGRKIGISYIRFPRRDSTRRSLGAIFVSDGGPGFSASTAQEPYVDLFGPLLGRRDLVLIDQRGVGHSGALDCERLQKENSPIYAAVAECGKQLGASADLFGSASVARDVDAVRAALKLHEFDYYGPSYAAMDIQAYAARFPDRLRSVVLDSPAVLSAADPWSTAAVKQALADVRRICLRSDNCSAVNHHPVALLRWVARRLRAHPVDGAGHDADGRVHELHLGEGRFAHLLLSDAGGFEIQGEVAAAARALRHGDPAPLLRIAAEQDHPLFHGDPADPAEFSLADNLARFCTDESFQWSKGASLAERRRQFRRARLALDPNRFAPFALRAWVIPPPVGILPDPCIEWPRPVHRVTAPVPPGTVVHGVPALVLAGELDVNGPVNDPRALSRLFRHSRIVELKNAGHITAFSNRFECAGALIRHFVLRRTAGNTSCARRRGYTYSGVERYPRRAGHSRTGAARVAVATLMDAFNRSYLASGPDGVGLRGGTFHNEFGDSGQTMHVEAARLAKDLPVTGDATYANYKTLDADLQVSGAHHGNLHVHGILFRPAARTLRVTGRLDGHRVSLAVPAT